MSLNITFCDTNIVRYLIENPEKWGAFHNHIKKNERLLGISFIQLVEIKKRPKDHDKFIQFLSAMPSILFKWWGQIIKEEIIYYPSTSKVNPILGFVTDGVIETTDDSIALRSWFEDDISDKVWEIFNETKGQYMPVLSWLPSTTPKPGTDRNIDFNLHNYGFVLGEVGDIDSDFLGDIKDIKKIKTELFYGSNIRAAYTYYRYINKGISPEESDIGDIHQVFYIPYCDEVIVEKSMAGFLHQLQKDKGLLDQVEIKSIRFVRELSDN